MPTAAQDPAAKPRNGSAGRRGPYAKTRGRKRSIATTARDVVIAKGHRDLTLAEVAAGCGITEAKLLYLFPNKDELLVAVVELDDQLAFEAHRQEIEALGDTGSAPPAPRDPVQDPAELISAVVKADSASVNLQRLKTSLRAEAADPTHPAHRWAAQSQVATRKVYGDWLRALQAGGWADPAVDPDRFALYLRIMWEGLTTQWLIDPNIDLAAEVAGAVRLLARADASAPTAHQCAPDTEPGTEPGSEASSEPTPAE